MKRLFLAILATMMMFTSVSAQRLAGVRAEASFITDRMVAELGLSSAQRGSILNINLAYLNGINSYRDIDSYMWHKRNKELKRMLTGKQWKRYRAANYFYRPIGWRDQAYVHYIYVKYPQHGYYGYGHKHGHPGKKMKKHMKHMKKHMKHMKKHHREFRNNEPEAIYMRHEMRRGTMRGAR